MAELILMVLGGMAGSLGLSIVFGIRPRRLPCAALAVFVTCVTYVLLRDFGAFLSNAAALFVGTLFCEFAARVQRAPVVTFLTPAAITLAPGGVLYHTVSSFMYKQYDATRAYGQETVETCLGIAAGILVASLIAGAFFALLRQIRLRGGHKGAA